MSPTEGNLKGETHVLGCASGMKQHPRKLEQEQSQCANLHRRVQIRISITLLLPTLLLVSIASCKSTPRPSDASSLSPKHLSCQNQGFSSTCDGRVTSAPFHPPLHPVHSFTSFATSARFILHSPAPLSDSALRSKAPRLCNTAAQQRRLPHHPSICQLQSQEQFRTPNRRKLKLTSMAQKGRGAPEFWPTWASKILKEEDYEDERISSLFLVRCSFCLRARYEISSAETTCAVTRSRSSLLTMA